MALTTGRNPDIETSAYGEVMNRVAQQVIDLNLPSILSRIYVLKRAFDQSLLKPEFLPCCVISMAPETATDTEGPVNTSTVHYPVLISLVWGSDRGQRENWGTQLLQRQQVARAFRKTRPTWAAMTHCTLKKTTVRSGEPFIDEATRQALDAQWLLIDVLVTEQLG